MVTKVFKFLNSKVGKISNNYIKQQLSSLDKLDGNVDSISNRIANVRTWSYVSNKSFWVENQDYWIERTKSLEDKLSDRLHQELTKSFIDKRASVLARGLKQDQTFETKIVDQKKVMINNQFIGELDYTIDFIERFIVNTQNGGESISAYSRAIKNNEPHLYENNFILNKEDIYPYLN